MVDEYLDLRERVFKGPGMKLSTKYLVMGPAPELTINANTAGIRTEAVLKTQVKMNDIMIKARQLGVQIVQDRKFLILMGIRLPDKPAQADYGNPIYLDVPARPADNIEGQPKKDEGK